MTLVMPSIKSDRSTEDRRDEEKDCQEKRPSGRIVAILMVTLGSLMALAFVLIGLGKAVEQDQHRRVVNAHDETKLILLSDGSLLTKLLLNEITVTISSTSI